MLEGKLAEGREELSTAAASQLLATQTWSRFALPVPPENSCRPWAPPTLMATLTFFFSLRNIVNLFRFELCHQPCLWNKENIYPSSQKSIFNCLQLRTKVQKHYLVEIQIAYSIQAYISTGKGGNNPLMEVYLKTMLARQVFFLLFCLKS